METSSLFPQALRTPKSIAKMASIMITTVWSIARTRTAPSSVEVEATLLARLVQAQPVSERELSAITHGASLHLTIAYLLLAFPSSASTTTSSLTTTSPAATTASTTILKLRQQLLKHQPLKLRQQLLNVRLAHAKVEPNARRTRRASGRARASIGPAVGVGRRICRASLKRTWMNDTCLLCLPRNRYRCPASCCLLVCARK